MKIEHDVLLYDKNTFRLGGTARFYAEPDSLDQLLTALKFANENNAPVFILGKGSNVLISDSGFPGLVITTSQMSNAFWDGDILEAQGGALLNTVVNMSIEKGYSGLEQLVGIPGTVGGAVVMNAGAFNSCIADTLLSVTYFDYSKSEVISISASELNLGYRTSAFYGKDIVIISARFRFNVKESVEHLRGIKQEILIKRKQKQPLEYPNCGSVFKRPPGNFAGTLIEQCGLKGLRSGGVEVSSKHANFIINRNHGQAADVRHLIVIIQKTVFEQTGILLEPEVIFIGHYDEPLFTPIHSGVQ